MTEVEHMLHVWHQWLATGNRAKRDEAYALADRIRQQAERERK